MCSIQLNKKGAVFTRNDGVITGKPKRSAEIDSIKSKTNNSQENNQGSQGDRSKGVDDEYQILRDVQ